MKKFEKYLSKKGFIEIDYNKSLSKQVEIGDELITTGMYVFTGYRDDIDLDYEKFDNRGESFIVGGVNKDDTIYFIKEK